VMSRVRSGAFADASRLRYRRLTAYAERLAITGPIS
jgi:hypothetical protein